MDYISLLFVTKTMVTAVSIKTSPQGAVNPASHFHKGFS